MTLTESIVEAATHEWFQELGYAIVNGPHVAPDGPAAAPCWFGWALLAGHLLRPALADAGQP